MQKHKGGRPFGVVARDMPETLTVALKHSKDEAYRVRIRCIRKVKSGKSRSMIAEELSVSIRAISEWVRKYNRGGLAGLVTKKSGRPEGNPKWDTAIFDALAEEIDTKKGYWSIPKMQEWIATHHKKEIPEQTVWYRMDKLNYS